MEDDLQCLVLKGAMRDRESQPAGMLNLAGNVHTNQEVRTHGVTPAARYGRHV